MEAGFLNILIDWRPGEKPAGAAAGGSGTGPFPHGSAVLQMLGGRHGFIWELSDGFVAGIGCQLEARIVLNVL